jgi:TPR repeat protein
MGRWHLFGEQPSVEVDVKLGFELVKEAHEMNNIEATAYYGHCLIRGLGVEKNKTDGYELLVDATGEGSGAGKDFAAYTLGFCYRYDVVSIKIAQTETMN